MDTPRDFDEPGTCPRCHTFMADRQDMQDGSWYRRCSCGMCRDFSDFDADDRRRELGFEERD